MAFTVTIMAQNTVGAIREAYIKVVTDDTSGAIPTPLAKIEDIDIAEQDGSDRLCDIYPNSKTASTTEDDPGWFFLNNCANPTTYRFLVMGRG
jgi:hypothetical protein